jgi:fatty-acyl-CoA synthase
MTKISKSYMCGEADEPLIYQTIGNYFNNIAERYPNTEAIVVRHQNVRWTYKQYQEQINKLATGLLSMGIKRGDRLGIWGPNSYEWCLTQFATAKIGAVMVCINPAYRAYELEYALNKVECKVIISAEKFKNSEYLAMLQDLAPELSDSQPGQLEAEKLPHLKWVIRMGAELSPGMLNFERVCELGGEQEFNQLESLALDLQPDDAINIQFTSGTTGRPKGATLTHCNILNNGDLTAKAMRLTPRDRLCIPVPLYHCFGMVLGNLACISTGSTAVFPCSVFDPLSTLQTVQEEKCTGLHGVPTMFISELEHPDFATFDLSSLRTGVMAGAPCPEQVMKRVINDMHMEHVLIGYGQTEVSPLNHITRPDDPIEKRIETVGRAVPRVEVKIIDEKGNVVNVGEKGEVCTRGYSVMLGYWNDPQKTAETIDSANWLHSGDIGIMDEQGYVRIVGRTKDMVIRGGENIYPREVEEFLYTHPKIQEVQVFGIPDKKMGEELCAWVQLVNGETMDDQELNAFCRGKITHFKIPRYIEFVDSFPMTVTGKIQKYKMREQMIER